MNELELKKGGRKNRRGGEIELDILAKRLRGPYKLGINLSLFFILFSMGFMIVFHKSGISLVCLPIQFILLFVIMWLKGRLREIENNIYLWGVEGAWKHYKGK